MVVYGQHRNRKLAERRLAELKRAHPKARVFIKERLNQDGTPSKRGQFYTFQIRYPRKNRYYIVSIKWKTRRFRGWGEREGYSTIVNRTMDVVVVTRDRAHDRQILDMLYRLPMQERMIVNKVMDVTLRGNDIQDGNVEISEGQLTSDPPGVEVRGFKGI